MSADEEFRIRPALPSDLPALRALIAASVRGLGQADYSRAVLDGALAEALGVDAQLIEDATYFVAEPADAPGMLAGSGGWSYRATLCGGDQLPGRELSLLDPATGAAKIRAIYIDPRYARRGLGTRLLRFCEDAAREAGFHRAEMGSTLTGVPLYTREGYLERRRFFLPLPNGAALEVVHMTKQL